MTPDLARAEAEEARTENALGVDYAALTRTQALLARYGLAHDFEFDERRKNAAAGFNPYSYHDPRHEPMAREIERIRNVRARRKFNKRATAHGD